MEYALCKTFAQWELGDWCFTVFFNPRVWWLGYHRNAACCKFWLLIGPFELMRVWTDEDVYPFD